MEEIVITERKKVVVQKSRFKWVDTLDIRD